MSDFRHQIRTGLLIGRLTFLEAVRQRFFPLLLCLGTAQILSGRFFQQVDFGASELKFLADFGLGAVVVFGTILAVAALAQLFFSELENRTVLTVLARAVHPLCFLVGKWLGTVALAGVFVVLLTVLLGGTLWQREQALLAQWPPGQSVPPGLPYADLAVFALVQIAKLAMTAALTLLVATLGRTLLFTLVMTALILVIGHLQYIAADAYTTADAGWLARTFAGLIGLVFPNYQVFNLGDLLLQAEGNRPGWGTILRILGYAGAYTMVFLAAAWALFRRREL
ncbi:MAG: ABC transporter permease [Opitutales bacterium]